MTRFFEPDLTANPDSPFVRDASNKLVRRSYWMDITDTILVMVMTKRIGANLTNGPLPTSGKKLSGASLGGSLVCKLKPGGRQTPNTSSSG
jgi:hypothetical protein